MKPNVKKLLSGMMAALMVISLCPTAWAEDQQPEEVCVVFSQISKLAIGESLQRTITEADGTELTVGIQKVPTDTRAGGETWRVWYKAIGADIEFYMTVANNRVTSVYDYSISLVGASFDDASLTKTSNYGKLTFTYKAVAGLAAYTCWLKGTVTGENDEIDVTWQM